MPDITYKIRSNGAVELGDYHAAVSGDIVATIIAPQSVKLNRLCDGIRLGSLTAEVESPPTPVTPAAPHTPATKKDKAAAVDK
ncbi:MAG TPA: hypothetical protein VM223_16020 [Planctomycetota bacterium]|nr:hypothetical protein [Planctomycetota bacterium]